MYMNELKKLPFAIARNVSIDVPSFATPSLIRRAIHSSSTHKREPSSTERSDSVKLSSMQSGQEPVTKQLPFIYGTAWKKDKTKELVRTAILTGFEKVDTAAQPKHYQEPLVGEAVRELIKEGRLRREEVYVSTS